MSESTQSEREAQATAGIASQLAAQQAERVALLTSPEAAIEAGKLPLWGRLGNQPCGGLAGLFWLTCWIVTALLLVIASLRIVAHDATTFLIWCNAFTLYLYLPVYFIVGLALWKSRWLLAAASALVVACHLYWVVPDFRPVIAREAADVSAPTVRIFYANVRGSNPDYRSLLDEIVAADPDVVVLVEYHHQRAVVTLASPVMQQYKYGSKLAQIYPGEVVVFSRLPVQRQQFANAAGRLVNIVDIEAGEETLRIIALHGHRPLVEEPDLYAKYWQAMDALLDSQPHPLVVIGDFNATQHSAVLKNLAAQGLRSAHSERGRGYATTWPNGVYPAPPIRIDHALLSAAVDCVEIVEGVGTGSDHRPLIVDVRVPRRSPAERLHQDP